MRLTIPIAIAASFSIAAEPRVRHEPVSPKPDTPVLVTARLAAGTSKATLRLQAVAPGKYIRKTDPAYGNEWTDMPMTHEGDGVFSIRVPASYQKHRWLVRYCIVAECDGKSVRIPDATDACPNSAWWCDDGPAAWSGSREPGKEPALTFSKEFLGTLQSMHLVARAEDVARSQWDGAFHKQKQLGTIIDHGIVYDHIQFSNRGQGSAYISGKNKWSLKFNRKVPFTDHAGEPFPDMIDSLNLNPGGSTPYMPVLRGITGLDEVLSMRAYRLAGVPSAPATWVQWRVVDQAEEVSGKDQSRGDLWGVYVAIGDMTPKLLADRKLPDGLVVSIQSGVKHTPKGMADGNKRWESFLKGMHSNPTEAWWRENLDLPAYYSFHAINRLLGNVDLRPDGNHGYYRNPNGLWAPIPWDNDMMFVPRHHQPGYIDAIGCLSHSGIRREYRNRAREILDLFAADAREDGGQIGQLAADLCAVLTPKNYTVDWPRLDDALWNNHPRMNQKGSYFVNPCKAEHFGGPWTRTLATNDCAGFRKYIVDFCTDSRPTKNYAPNDGDPRGYGWGYLAHECRDNEIPVTANVERISGTWRFKASTFDSPAKHQPVALEWRVGFPQYELAEHWRKESKAAECEIPAEVFKQPGVYRVRARWRDQTGRCGHWSKAVEIRVSPKR